MNEENNGFNENDAITNTPTPKKKNVALIVIVTILCIAGVGTALGFAFKGTLLYTFSPKSYLATALSKTSLKLASEVDASIKNNKFLNSVDTLKYDNSISTISLSDESSALLGIPAKMKLLFSNDTKAERFSIDLNDGTKSLFSFYFSNDKAVVNIPNKSLYFNPATFSQDYNVWIVQNQDALVEYGIDTFPDSISESANFSYKAQTENYLYKDLMKTLNGHFMKLLDTAKVEKQTADYKFGTEVVPSKEIKLTFASKDLQEFYNKSIESAIADKDFYAQLEVQAASSSVTVDEMIATYKDININGDISVKFNIYKDSVVSSNVNFIGADAKVAFIIKTNNMANMISDFSIEVAADESKLNLDVVGDFLNKDMISTTTTLQANGMTLGKLKTEWDQNKTTDNLMFTVSDVPPMFSGGGAFDISLFMSAYTENDIVIFNVGKLNVATESVDVGFLSKIEELKTEIVIPQTDIKIFDLTAKELFESIQ